MNRVLVGSLILAGLLQAAMPLLRAQDEPPNPPLLASLSATAEWVVKYPAASKPEAVPGREENAAPRLTEVVVTRDDKMRREKSHWSNEAVTERWMVGDFALFEQPGTPGVFIVRRGSNNAQFMLEMFDLGQSDFPELQWIDGKCYAGRDKIDGKECYLFSARSSFNNPVQGNTRRTGEELKAWVDVATRLPVAFQSGDQLRKYVFTQAPGGRLVMPERFQQALNKYLKAREQAVSHEMKVN